MRLLLWWLEQPVFLLPRPELPPGCHAQRVPLPRSAHGPEHVHREPGRPGPSVARSLEGPLLQTESPGLPRYTDIDENTRKLAEEARGSLCFLLATRSILCFSQVILNQSADGKHAGSLDTSLPGCRICGSERAVLLSWALCLQVERFLEYAEADSVLCASRGRKMSQTAISHRSRRTGSAWHRPEAVRKPAPTAPRQASQVSSRLAASQKAKDAWRNGTFTERLHFGSGLSGLGQDTMSPSPKRMTSCRVVPERLINGIDKFIEGDAEEVRFSICGPASGTLT